MPPPRPQVFFGRGPELEQIVDILLQSSQAARVAILGTGGVGKTALSLAVLADARVAEAFEDKRYFITCSDACTSAASLISDIAQALGLLSKETLEMSAKETAPLEQRLLFHLGSMRCILCLDNFESPWDRDVNDKKAVETLLAKITALPTVTVLITMRGTQRPADTVWTSPFLPPLKPLSPEAAQETWTTIAGQCDDWALKLIQEVDYLPLAVTLLASLTQSYSAEHLWGRWQKEHTALITSSGGHRLTNLEFSMQLSINSDRVKSDPLSMPLLSALSMLPDGIHIGQVDIFQNLLDIPNLLQSANPLLQSSLIYLEDGRLQVQSLIRHFCDAQYPAFQAHCSALLKYYIGLAAKGHNPTDANVHDELSLDIKNMEAMLQISLKSGQTEDMTGLVKGITGFTMFSLYRGVYSDTLIKQATELCRGKFTQLYGDCLCCWGSLHLSQDNLQEAEKGFTQALQSYQQAKHDLGQANALNNLADVQHRLCKYEEAEGFLHQALRLHKKGVDPLGQAHDLNSLAEVSSKKREYVQAEKYYQQALHLHRKASSQLGQANDLHGLGTVYERMDRVDTATEKFQEALKLHTAVNDHLGQANDLLCIADLHVRGNRFDEAQESYQGAFELFKSMNVKLGQGNALQSLGKLHRSKGRYTEAKQYYEQAMEFHTAALDYIGQGNDLKGIASVLKKGIQGAEAIQNYHRAIVLFEKANNPRGKANCLGYLGSHCLRENRLDQAENYFLEALQLHKETKERIGEGNVLCSLGDIYRKLLNIDKARMYYEQAYKLHELAGDKLGLGNDLRGMGQLHYKAYDYKAASEKFQKALELHRSSGNVRSQMADMRSLKDTYSRLGQTAKANEIAKELLELKDQTKESEEVPVD